MKGVGGINNKKNIVLPSCHFITPTYNAYYEALAKNDNTDNNDDNNLYTPVSILKQKENNSFDKYLALIVGVDNNDTLAKKENKVNNNNNYSINTIDRSKEGVGTINIVETPGTGNNSNTTIESFIESSKAGVDRKELDHTNSVAWAVLDHVRTLDLETRMWYGNNSTTDTAETRAWYAKNSLFDTAIVADVPLDSDSVSDTSRSISDA